MKKSRWGDRRSRPVSETTRFAQVTSVCCLSPTACRPSPVACRPSPVARRLSPVACRPIPYSLFPIPTIPIWGSRPD